jgi:dihydroorotase
MTDTPSHLDLPWADDLHVHLRQGPLLAMTGPTIRAGGAGRVLVMPNLKPPVSTPDQAAAYRAAIAAAAPGVQALMTLYLGSDLTPAHVAAAPAAGVVAVKSYPKGVTTNSEAGTLDLDRYDPIFHAMDQAGLILSLHGEVPSDHDRGICILNAEERFLDRLVGIHRRHPGLRIVLEHVTTAAAVDCVRSLGATVAATITVHHLDLTVDHWAGRNHNFCKPVAKYPSDRAALRRVVADNHPRFFLGSDSAPHPRCDKESACGCAGVFTQPLLMPYLADVCERIGALTTIADFASTHGRAFYGLPALPGGIRLVRRPTVVPDAYGADTLGAAGAVVPFRAGETLAWSMA